MGKNARAGKRTPKQREMKKMTSEARQISAELESTFSRRMLPVAVTEAFILLLNAVCIVLHDDYGFGKKRLGDTVDHVINTWECVLEGYVTMDELSEELIRMCGIRMALTPEESEQLKEYGLKGFANEVMLNEEQKEYFRSNIANDWHSTVNRYGKEVV